MREKKSGMATEDEAIFLWLNFDSKIVSHAYIYTFSFISSLRTCTGGLCMGKRNSTCKLYYVQKWNRVYFFRSFFDSIDSQCEFILIVKCVCAFRLSQRTDRKIDATRMRWQGLFPCQIKQNVPSKYIQIPPWEILFIFFLDLVLFMVVRPFSCCSAIASWCKRLEMVRFAHFTTILLFSFQHLLLFSSTLLLLPNLIHLRGFILGK